jgi:hypothetical protein
MDPFHERLARVALDAAGSYGFALAGGYAVQAHGFLNRMSAEGPDARLGAPDKGIPLDLRPRAFPLRITPRICQIHDAY